MAIPSRWGVDKKINSMEGLSAYENGGKGSGNFGHSGRPGEVGGSGGGGLTEDVGKKTEVLVDVPDEYGDKVKEYMGSSEYKARYEKLQEAISKEKTAESVMIKAKEKLAEMGSKLKSNSDGKLSAKALDEYSAYKKEKLAKTSDFNRAKAERKSAEQRIADGFKDAVLKSEEKGLEIEASIGKIGGSKDLLIVLRKKNSSEDTAKTLNGGKGSGNFGHSGRPGKRGGSGNGTGGSRPAYLDKMSDSDIEKEIKNLEAELDEYDRLNDKIQSRGLSDEEIVDEYGYEDFTGYGADLVGRIDTFRTELQKRKGNKESKKASKTREVPLKGMSVREKYEAIREGDEVHFIPKDNLPNFDRKIKVDFIRDGVPHYGLSETSDGHTYPFWAVKDIKKIIRGKK